jgi:hypothetical protein
VISEGNNEVQNEKRIQETERELRRVEEANRAMSQRLKEAIESSIQSEKLASLKEVEKARLADKIERLEAAAKNLEDSEGKWEQEIKRLTQQLASTKEESITQTTQLTTELEKLKISSIFFLV